MFEASYISADGQLKHKQFSTLEESRQFFAELAKTIVPIKTYSDCVPQPKKLKMRIEEVNILLSENYETLCKIYQLESEPLLERLLNERITLEIEKSQLEHT